MSAAPRAGTPNLGLEERVVSESRWRQLQLLQDRPWLPEARRQRERIAAVLCRSSLSHAENVTGFWDEYRAFPTYIPPDPSKRIGAASMLYIVEVGSVGRDLGATLSNMRMWLDHRRLQPVMFQQVAGDGTMLRLEFRSEAEALAFIGTFGGRLFRPEPSASAA